MHLLEDKSAGRALRRGQRHRHFDALPWKRRGGVRVRLGGNVVDQSEVHEVQLDLRVKAIAQGSSDIIDGKWRQFERSSHGS